MLPSKLTPLSKEEINTLPLVRYDGPIHLITHPDRVAGAVDRLRREPLLGFDTETRPAFRKGESYPPALVQLADAEAVYIFQLARLGGAPDLGRLLADPAITKCGMAPADDVRELQQRVPFEPAGFVDLAAIARREGFKRCGLRTLTATLLSFRISKGAQRSNWGRRDLSDSQITYAATDAWASRQVYLAMARQGWNMTPEQTPAKK